ncbi:MAG: hypothetical protein IKE33_05920 [Erysipelotrichaceae bacterium]|nr:hypothetical protein [Erysipelotrichaceae bacterium]MBR2809733.1 hypothetical protein [Erysipelotrichaceae bacterium]
MSKKKNKKFSEPEKDYYKLHTDAVDRLANAEKGTVPKVSDEELNKYNSSILNRIPIWVKAMFIKFWFAGAVCFFFFWGLSVYLNSWLDQVFILGIGMGIVTDILTNNILRFLSSDDKEYYPYMMFEENRYWTFIANILYAFIVLTIVIGFYRLLKMNVEPILFGIIYTAVDMLFITIKNRLFKKERS